MVVRHLGWVSILAVLVGCSSGGDGAGDVGGGRALADPTANPAAGASAAAGMGATAGTSGGGLFNTNTNTRGMMPPPNIIDTECQVGEQCVGDNDPDEMDCGKLRLEPEVERTVTREPGNLLVIFDQSGSMGEQWQGGTTKMQAAQNALVQALTPLQDDLTVGAMFFPTNVCVLWPAPGGSVEPITGPQQLPFQPGPQFLQAWSAKFAGAPPAVGVGTPLQEAMDRADIAISDAINNMTITGPLAVVVFTDGEPNCADDTTITMIPVDTEVNRAYKWLNDYNVKTYTVGLPGGQGVQVLQDIAYYGGTQTYIVPDDPAVLQAELAKIVSETVTETVGFNSCSISLNPPAMVPDELAMVVEESGMLFHMPHMQDQDVLWTISPDGSQVELLGGLCQRAQEGYYASINFEFACEVLPPPPPIPAPT
jgi:hypothetical protein